VDAAVAKCSEYRPLFAVPILQHKRRLTAGGALQNS